MTRSHLQYLCLAVSVLGGCSSNLGEAIQPQEKTAKEALGEASNLEACEPDYAKPLIIDISPEARGDLEVKLKQGGPVVSFNCKSLKVLPTCRMKSVKYNFIGYTPKAQLVELESSDDLAAALPINGMTFKAALGRSGRLNLATMTVGQRSASMLVVDPTALEGECDGATHVVNSVWVGAFKLETGAKGEIGAAVDVFGAGASADSKAERKAMTMDGDVRSCESAKEDATAPPSGCTAFVRLELLKIPKGATKPALPPQDPENEQAVAADRPVGCPQGRTFDGKFCAAPTAATCSKENVAPCKVRCDKKDGDACFVLAVKANEDGNWAEAKPLFDVACEGGNDRACYNRAQLEKSNDLAIPLLKRSCGRGHEPSCLALSSRYKYAKEPALSFTYAKRSCDLGGYFGCTRAAQALLAGSGTTKDVAKGVAIYEGLCNAGTQVACDTLGREYARGTNTATNLALAEKWFKKGCDDAESDRGACSDLGELYEKKGDAAGAKAAFEMGCAKGNRVACDKVGKPPPANAPPPPPKKP